MSFHSDNEVGIAPEILAALSAINDGTAMPYGEDKWSRALDEKFADLFEVEVKVFLVSTGTAANALALSALSPAYGAIYCHEKAHIHVDECGAPEFYTGGAKLILLSGAEGKLHAGALKPMLRQQRTDVHYVKPSVLSLTQATEFGTVYRPDEIRELAGLAHEHGLYVHMDGTRFVNAVVQLDCAPADISWRAGVDVMCFGATKNGAFAAEAVVFFKQDLAEGFASRRKRGGHLLSKMRFMAVQMDAYLTAGRWRTYAEHANNMAQKLAMELVKLEGVRLAFPVEADLVFVTMPETLFRGLERAGYQLDYWSREARQVLVRFVTAFNTSEGDITKLIKAVDSLS